MFKTEEGKIVKRDGDGLDQQHQQQHGKAVGNENYGFIYLSYKTTSRFSNWRVRKRAE